MEKHEFRSGSSCAICMNVKSDPIHIPAEAKPEEPSAARWHEQAVVDVKRFTDAPLDWIRGAVEDNSTVDDLLMQYAVTQRERVLELEQENAELRQVVHELDLILNTPETDDFFKGVPLEAAHQRQRWPSELDAGKSSADWFWLVGYLAGKCLQSAIAGNTEKALHHTISTAAALANWHRAIKGMGNMRPGIDTPAEAILGGQRK